MPALTLTAPEIKDLAGVMIPMFREAMREEWREMRAEFARAAAADNARIEEKFAAVKKDIEELQKANRVNERSRVYAVGYFAGLTGAAAVLATLIEFAFRYVGK